MLSEFAREVGAMKVGWYHPILPLIVHAAVLRFDRDRRRDQVFCAAVFTVLMLGYFGVYLATPLDLTWHFQTSLSRLLAQSWPLFVIAAVIGMRVPESTAILEAEAAPKERRKGKK